MPQLLYTNNYIISQCAKMTQPVYGNGSRYLTSAGWPVGKDPKLARHARACASNDISSALSSSTHLDASGVTFRLNVTIQQHHLELARRLLDLGAKWDAHTIRDASGSFGAVKLLVECGYNVNTGLVGGGTLLLYIPYPSPVQS